MVSPAAPAADLPAKERRNLGIAAVLIGAACLAGMVVLPRLARSSSAGPRHAAPTFALPIVMNGEPGSRLALADLKGKPVLLDFWAFWCGPCRMEGPIVDRVAEKYKDRGLAVVGVSVDGDDEEVKSGARAAHMTYPVLSDVSHDVQRAYAVNTLPTLVLIDRDGNVVNASTGTIDEASLDDMVRDAL